MINWTPEEDAILKDLWENSLEPSHLIPTIGNKTFKQMQRRAWKLQLKRNPHAKSIATIERNKSARDLSEENIRKIASGYKTKQDFMMNDFSAYVTARRMEIVDSLNLPNAKSTNIPQTLLFLVVSHIFPLCQVSYNTRKIIKPLELDVFVHEHKIAFEYDGKNWHKDNVENDIAKNEKCISEGIRLIRIEERDKLKPLPHIIQQLSENGFDVQSIDHEKIFEEFREKFMVTEIEELKNIISKYTTLKDFRRNEQSAYARIIRTNQSHLLEHLDQQNRNRTESDIKKELDSVTSKHDFRNKFHATYIYLHRNKARYTEAWNSYLSL